MSEAINPAAPHHLPAFITGPGETDVLMWAMGALVLAVVIGVGVLYLRLHALPEHIAHRTEKVQLQFVAILCLLALFTHNHVFWIAALLLAFVQLPDFSTPLSSMAGSLARLADRRPRARSEATVEPAGEITLPPQVPQAGDGAKAIAAVDKAQSREASHA